MNSIHLLQTQDLQVFYGKVGALMPTALTVDAGQIVTVIGPNGAGKSSMLNAIAGALPANAHSGGKMVFDRQDISHMAVEQRVATGLSLVPEKRELFASMKVEDNLLLGSYRRYQTGEKHYADQLPVVYELFPRLKERRHQDAGTLSGGERQMLALGRALMAKPRLLLLDEPSLGLAPLIVKEIFHIIDRLKQTGVGILLVEQNARAALQVADYAYVLEMGEVALQGTAKDLLHDERVIETYLGLNRKAASPSA
jgi:branched-chain amino acid transport system ATP-binding protein